MRYLREVFDDWWIRAAAIVFTGVVIVVAFNSYSGVGMRNPLLGMFSYSLVPILFVVGGAIFVLAILRESED